MSNSPRPNLSINISANQHLNNSPTSPKPNSHRTHNNLNNFSISDNFSPRKQQQVQHLFIALVTCKAYPELNHDDHIMKNIINASGHRYEIVIWDSPDVNWKSYDCIVIRSLWDYVEKVDELKGWISKMKEMKIRVLNDLSAIMWNLDKNYLGELQSCGIPIVPSYFIRKQIEKAILTVNDLAAIIQEQKKNGKFESGAVDFVYKPTIGAGGYGTNKFNLDQLFSSSELRHKHLNILNTLLKKSDVILQPYIASIKEVGETSFLFFNGKFSHSIIKTPCINDFRVQEDYGGLALENNNPKPDEIQLAQSVIDNIIVKHQCNILYARIDMLRINGKLHLGESEIFEPTLYFMKNVGIAKRFVDSIQDIMSTPFVAPVIHNKQKRLSSYSSSSIENSRSSNQQQQQPICSPRVVAEKLFNGSAINC
ncbi:hypothetical protein CYY_003750 [Polysphondylium violaceum]|uniref:ATP-grasp domain-containing protein n=1 Tax=Polysphondylium violaceum TaxID=133409 RepID=A0A8J4PWC6_9MYCE|nr:hypothetical protein CYY_003750 [Polysphondylium violaceum]